MQLREVGPVLQSLPLPSRFIVCVKILVCFLVFGSHTPQLLNLPAQFIFGTQDLICGLVGQALPLPLCLLVTIGFRDCFLVVGSHLPHPDHL